jgi:hypothetical protein
VTPNDVLTAAAVAGVFFWIGAELVVRFFCVQANPPWLREAMKLALIGIYLRLTAATLGDMPLDYFGSLAYVFGALVGAAVLIHHLRRAFRFKDRCVGEAHDVL